jgi:Protein of unknown function (DUF2786)
VAVGVNNRQRRKAKQKARQGRHRIRAQAGEGTYDAGLVVNAIMLAAMHAKACGEEARLGNLLASLSEPRVKAVVDVTLPDEVQGGIAEVWQRGWQPADLACAARRMIGTHAQGMLIDMAAAQMREYARATVDETWEQQLTLLGATVWWERDDLYLDAFGASRPMSRLDSVACAIDVLAFLNALPQLGPLCPPPGEARRGSLANARTDGDTRTLERVRALLAKAERTDYPEEAEAYTAKAQELMTRHSIDYAMLGAPKAGKQEPTGRRIAVDNPYEAPKAILLDVTATANRCKAVWSRTFGFSTVVGFAADVAATELLFTSLLLQATAALRAAGSQKDGRTTSFRRSFLTAYANRIGQRLDQANQSAMDSATQDYGGNLLPVLASREKAVKEAVDRMFPSLYTQEMGAPTNRQGWMAGLAAADRAKLDQQLELEFS